MRASSWWFMSWLQRWYSPNCLQLSPFPFLSLREGGAICWWGRVRRVGWCNNCSIYSWGREIHGRGGLRWGLIHIRGRRAAINLLPFARIIGFILKIRFVILGTSSALDIISNYYISFYSGPFIFKQKGKYSVLHFWWKMLRKRNIR